MNLLELGVVIMGIALITTAVAIFAGAIWAVTGNHSSTWARNNRIEEGQGVTLIIGLIAFVMWVLGIGTALIGFAGEYL